MKIRKNGGAAVRKQGEKYRDQEPEIKEMETEKREREREGGCEDRCKTVKTTICVPGESKD